MNDHDLIDLLADLTDGPVEPPDDLRADIWHQIETSLGTTGELAVEGVARLPEAVEMLPVVPRKRLAAWWVAAAAFLVVIGVGAVVLWLPSTNPPAEVVDTTVDTSSLPSTEPLPGTAVVGIDGSVLLPEGYYPSRMADAGQGQIVVIAEREPRVGNAQPQENGTVMIVDPQSGEIVWETDLDGGPSVVVASEDAVWVAHYWTGAVTKVDRQTGEIQASAVPSLPFEFGDGPDRHNFIPSDLEIAFGSVWMSTARGAVAEIDLGTGALREVTEVTVVESRDTPALLGDLEASDTHIWIAADTSGVYVLDPADHSLERISPVILDHTGDSLVFHEGTMLVAGWALQRDANSETQGSHQALNVARVTGFDPEAVDWQGLAWRGLVELPVSSAQMLVVGDQLFARHDNVLWPVDAEHVVAGPPIELAALSGAWVAESGETLWLVDSNARSLHPLSLDDVLAGNATSMPGIEGPEVLWEYDGDGMTSWAGFMTSGVVLMDDERVYVADGFGGHQGEGQVVALSSSTGEVVWARDDLALEGTIFLQAVEGDTLIVNGQRHMVRAVDAATGDTRWTFQLPDNYGAVGSIVVDNTLVVAADAQMEGDTRPPIVFGIDFSDGTQRWRTVLTEGTDLQWHPPAVADGVVVVSSTLSHPESAPGNMVHALGLGTGAIRWEANLGGTQGFHHAPILIDAGAIFLRGPRGVVALDLADGDQLWHVEGAWPLALDPDGAIIAGDGSPYGDVDTNIWALDPTSGARTLLVEATSVLGHPMVAVVEDNTLLTVNRWRVARYDLGTGDLIWSWAPMAPVVDRAALGGGRAVMPTGDRTVVAITAP